LSNDAIGLLSGKKTKLAKMIFVNAEKFIKEFGGKEHTD